MFVCYELVLNLFHIYSVLRQDHIKTTGLAVIFLSVRSPRTVPMPICEGGPEGSGDYIKFDGLFMVVVHPRGRVLA
jgi:hypothetical protein